MIPVEYVPAFHRVERLAPADTLVVVLSGGWSNELKLADALSRVDAAQSTDFIVGRSGGVRACVPDGAASTYLGDETLDWRGRPVAGSALAVTLCNKAATSSSVAMSKRYLRRAPYGWLEARRPADRHVRHWEQFGRPQLCALVELVPTMVVAHPRLQFICGHEDLVREAQGPGPAFPWGLLDYDELGLVRMERCWETGRWFERRGRRRKEVDAA